MNEGLTAGLFDGQGYFEPGMGQSVYKKYAASRLVFKDASEAAGVDMARVCWGDLTYLQDDPRIVQPAIITVDLAEYAAWLEWNEAPDVVTGLSLGMYAAMGAAEVFSSYVDTVIAVSERAKILYEIHKKSPGGMAGFVGIALHQLEPILAKTGAKLAVMRDRARNSVVIAGAEHELKQTELEVKKNGVRKFEALAIFGRFHHEGNQDGQSPFRDVLDSLSLNNPKIRLLGNHAIFLDTADDAVNHVVEQLVQPVDWDKTIDVLAEIGVTRVIETGPDATRGLARQMTKRFKTQAIKFPEVP